jgi:hypothetical protein
VPIVTAYLTELNNLEQTQKNETTKINKLYLNLTNAQLNTILSSLTREQKVNAILSVLTPEQKINLIP